MRPIKLTICGINSYTTPQVIDFKSLSETRLFGIFGQTGSGKSTILDSIILALFGSTDRDNLTSMINVNLQDAYVDFEFEMEHEKTVTYRVLRTFKIRPSGFKSSAELTDLTNKINLGDSTDKVNEQLLKIIGIPKKEFLKCIALPQNEFDKFITDAPQERKRSIAKIFNLENFGENLNEKVKEKINVLNVKKSTLQEQLNAFSYVTSESQKELAIKLNTLQSELGKSLKKNDKLNQTLSNIKDKFDKSKQYNVAKHMLDDINLHNAEFMQIQMELDYFKSNKEIIDAYNSIKEKIIAIENNKQRIAELVLTIDNLNNKLNNLNNNLRETEGKLEIEKITYNTFKVQLEKNKIINDELEKLNFKLNTLQNNHEYLQGEYYSNSEQAKQYLKLIDVCSKNCENLKIECEQLNEVHAKINEFLSFNESENFAKYLTEIKMCFNQTNLDEVENYRIYKDVVKALTKINKHIFEYKNKINKREEIIAELNISSNKINEYNKKIDGELSLKDKKLSEELLRLSDLKETSLKIEYETKSILKEINSVKSEILNINNEIKNFKQNLNTQNLIDNSNIIQNLELEIEQLKGDEIALKEDINKYQSEINALNVSNKFLDEEIEKENKKIPTNFKSDYVLNGITDQNFKDYETRLNEYLNNKAYYQTLTNKLLEELNGDIVEEKYVLQIEDEYNSLQSLINNLRVEVGIVGSQLEANEKILEKNNKIKADLKLVDENLSLILKLQALISKNALVDFVAEEYLYLITEYSNKFVYKISKGKYLLRYNSKTSEFVALDNFNGGIERSIKTLSGGERFIFSLSLALGISQSIAVSNNKTFNFFFIDEGFGNLSDDYINNVLECFDTLIRLDFTIGFITHIEKMQEFITNKLVVTKDENNAGSVITQY